MSNNVQSFFNRYSKEFSEISSSVASNDINSSSGLLSLFNRIFRNSMISRFNIAINTIISSNCDSVLDIGCGPGDYSIALRKEGVDNITALDFSQKMIDMAVKLEKATFSTNKIKWESSDFLNYPIDSPYDGVIVVGVMDYIEDPKAFVEEVYKATGKVAVISFPVDGGFMAWQRKFRYKKRCYLRMYSEEEVRLLFKELDCNVEIMDLGRDYLAIVKK